MITLTLPAIINSVLGGNVPVNYDKFIVEHFTFFPETGIIRGSVKITSTANPDMPEIMGGLDIKAAQSLLTIEVEQLDFNRRVTLTGPQANAVLAIIADAQNALEGGLIALGVIDGVQSTGT